MIPGWVVAWAVGLSLAAAYLTLGWRLGNLNPPEKYELGVWII